MKHQRRHKKLIMLGLTLLVWSALVGVWAWIWHSHYSEIIIRPFGYKGNWLIYFVYGLIAFFFTSLYGGYRVGYYRREDVTFSHIFSILIANGITYLQTCLVGRAIMNVAPFFLLTVLDIAIIWIWSHLAHRVYIKLHPPHNMLVIYGGNRLAESLIYKMTTRSEKYKICQAISVDDESFESLCEMLLQHESAIICDVRSELRNKILKFCFEHGVRTYVTPKISDIIVRGARDINLFDTPLLLCREHGPTAEQRFFKRAMDIVLASVGLLFFSPLMLLIALAIKLQDRGPVLLRQERYTKDSKRFLLLKFRSMIVDAEKDCIPRLASQDDQRITPIGRLIRSTRLDELPQLLNILRGEMSIVGPRPERPEIAAGYEGEMPEFSYRLKMKAGLTGYAQVMGKYNTTPYDKLKLDLMYIENYSLLLDIRLILMTFKIIFMKESTEGIPAPTTPADSGEE